MITLQKKRSGIARLLLSTLPVAGCGVAEGPIYVNYAAPPNVVAEAQIGAKGGVVESEDGGVSVEVPAGALRRSEKLTLARVDAPTSGALGVVYELGPTSTKFAAPVHVTLVTEAALLGEGDHAALAQLGAEAWRPLELGAFDVATFQVTGSTTRAGTYGVVSVPKSSATCHPERSREACCEGACSSCLVDCCRAPSDDDSEAAKITLETTSPAICQCSSSAWLACAEQCVADGEGVDTRDCDGRER